MTDMTTTTTRETTAPTTVTAASLMCCATALAAVKRQRPDWRTFKVLSHKCTHTHRHIYTYVQAYVYVWRALACRYNNNNNNKTSATVASSQFPLPFARDATQIDSVSVSASALANFHSRCDKLRKVYFSRFKADNLAVFWLEIEVYSPKICYDFCRDCTSHKDAWLTSHNVNFNECIFYFLMYITYVLSSS